MLNVRKTYVPLVFSKIDVAFKIIIILVILKDTSILRKHKKDMRAKDI
jgi:hypothetical protein